MAKTKGGGKAKKGERNHDRPNGKAWKQGLPPEKRGQQPAKKSTKS